MELNYEGWCRRIDLSFRAKFPFLTTRIFKVNKYEFHIYVKNQPEDFSDFEKTFNHEVKFVTAPIKLVRDVPEKYEAEMEIISDEEIPSNFSGIPFTVSQIFTHIASVHPSIKISGVREDHDNQKIIVDLDKNTDHSRKIEVQKTADALECPYSFQVIIGDSEAAQIRVTEEIFNIAPSQSRKMLSCDFLDRDESLWYGNIDRIYGGSLKKQDLYFIDKSKTSCLVNFSRFQNANLRNHLLLYDVVYCALPMAKDMPAFLKGQKISREEILDLAKRDRIKIVNMMPESQLDYGFLSEVYQENPSSIVSRRALSALCAIDLVELNQAYIFSDPELEDHIYPLLKEMAQLTHSSVNTISNLLLWPKQALRASLNALNQSGPTGIASYGVNKPITELLPLKDRDKFELEFLFNSDQIHLAHALDATYFPFYVEGKKYSDHPYALIMGALLNFYKNSNYQTISQFFDVKNLEKTENPSLSLIATFDINDYIPILEFEEVVSSGVVRKGMNSLFSELKTLDAEERNERISHYNNEVDRLVNSKKFSKHALDLTEDAVGLVVPFFSTGKKLITEGTKKAMKSYPSIQKISDIIQDKTTSKKFEQRQISLLSTISRVARLRREFN